MKDTVSVIIPTFNESIFIEKSLTSFTNQDCRDYNIEILVVDGGSTDTTLEIVRKLQKEDKRIQILHNQKRKTPFAFNIGIEHSKGNYILIAGAHSLYPQNYIYTCLKELKAKKAVGCSGKTITNAANSSSMARLSAWVTGHSFGTSPSSFRNMKEGYANTLPRAVYNKQAVIDAGLYNEELTRNQDNDLNQRLTKNGGQLYYTWKTSSIYYAKANISSLMKFAYTNGSWNVLTFFKNPSSMKTHHFIPLFFVLSLLLLTTASILTKTNFPLNLMLLGIGLHLALGFYFSIKIYFLEKTFIVFYLPLVFLSFHLYYGSGSLVTFARKIIFKTQMNKQLN